MITDAKPENQARADEGEIPTLLIKLPRQVTSIHQIEITSRCNLRCVYCPSPKLARPKVDMLMETFRRAVEMVKHFHAAGTQRELNLAGIGESTIHPQFVEMVDYARQELPNIELIMATNGLTIADQPSLAEVFVRNNVAVFVSLHRPEKAGRAVKILKDAGARVGVSVDPSVNSNDWAGQVDWVSTTQYATPCMWIRQGMAMVMADGRITACCLDASGAGVIGAVSSKAAELTTKPYDLCKSCHQLIKIRGYNQKEAACVP